MAVLINMAVIADKQAEAFVAELFRGNGWKVRPGVAVGQYKADLFIQKRGQAFVVEVKAFSEWRPDRVLPLLSLAMVQAQAFARAHGKARPLAIVYLNSASPSLVKHLRVFASNFASDVAIGVVSGDGFRHFIGEGLEGLSAEEQYVRGSHGKAPGLARHLFSDLNQWMLKVLLAPEIPEQFLAAPRGLYRNVSELAKAANVSQMSASRFIRQLKADGYLDESARHLKLVRRAELFQRWQASGLRASPRDAPMVFMLGGPINSHLRQLERSDACLGLFAAADALELGHVSGVPPHVYIPKWDGFDSKRWAVIPAEARPDFILREPRAPQSIFRGIVRPEGVPVCDVMQVWLDVSSHPSRGAEQAEVIYRKVLRPIVEG
ncbi:MAG: RpiR family transcriptional regulator [Acidobacteriota bacterium]|nr:RpiR family transcriptional regulator [Acidobacteriota bacterium]